MALLLHGGGLDGRQWHAVRARLPDFEVRAPDLPGHGVRRGERLTLEGALAAALDALDGQAAHVVGHSAGGALELARGRRPAPWDRSALLRPG